MGENLYDWLLLTVRWLHIITGVCWIGESFFFMWLDASFIPRPDKKPEEGHVGDLHMVHGGGFYHVQKLLIGPNEVPKHLHWFRWEAAFTWLTGILLLGLIFYSGNGTFLLDETISDISFGTAVSLSITSIVVSWIFYDLLWESALAESTYLAHLLTVSYFCGITYLLCQTLSGRAAYYHVAAIIGTWMVGNVWVRILPRQAKMIEESKLGRPVNQNWGVNAKNRSTHNNYFTLGLLFIMISNHFPATYGHEQNWFVLIIISLSGALIRHFFNVKHKKGRSLYRFILFGVAFIVAAVFMTQQDSTPLAEVSQNNSVEHKGEQGAPVKEKVSTGTEATRYSIKGIVRFDGNVPAPKRLRLPKACAVQHANGAFDNSLLVDKGLLKNALVRITKGVDRELLPPVDQTPVVLDQIGCLYKPRVIGTRVNRPVHILNSDPIFHNVKAITQLNRKFNDPMPAKKRKIVKVFSKPEITVMTKCSVHPWMGGHIAVVDHPYFDVTKGNGTFHLKGVPSGQYIVEAWHEKLGAVTKTIHLDGQDEVIDFEFK